MYASSPVPSSSPSHKDGSLLAVKGSQKIFPQVLINDNGSVEYELNAGCEYHRQLLCLLKSRFFLSVLRLTQQEQDDLMLARALAASEEEDRQRNARRPTVRLTVS